MTETKRRLRVYIAGPLSDGDTIKSRHAKMVHVLAASVSCRALQRAGYAPLCPHLTYYVDPDNVLGYDNWLEVDEAWVAVADAVLRLPGVSKGADRECELAVELGIPVFSSIDYLNADRHLLPLKPPRNDINDAPVRRSTEEIVQEICGNPRNTKLLDELRALHKERCHDHFKGVELPKAIMGGVRSCYGDPRFLGLLDELRDLHIKKAKDYGTDGDSLANLRASAELGIPPWKAAVIRLRDKLQRLAAYCVNGTLANEGVEDTLKDMAAYSLLTLILHREEGETK